MLLTVARGHAVFSTMSAAFAHQRPYFSPIADFAQAPALGRINMDQARVYPGICSWSYCLRLPRKYRSARVDGILATLIVAYAS